MTAEQIMSELQAKGSDSVKNIWLKHGIKEPFFGVKVADLKVIEKKVKKNYPLALQLYATGNADAMYLAALITDDGQMTIADLQAWVLKAESSNISSYAVPWVAAGSRYGFELALQWIEDKEEHIAVAGWATLANIVSLQPDSALDISVLRTLLQRVTKGIHTARNREKQAMNGYIISLGSYVNDLSAEALKAADSIGVLTADMNGTACKVPLAADYIQKAIAKGSLTKKKKTVKC